MGERFQIYGGWGLAAALLAVALWQASDWSRSRYALREDEDRVVVERGTGLVFAWTVFDDPNPRLRAAYAPVPRPPATTIRASERSGRPLAAFSVRAVTRAAPAMASAGRSTVTGCGAVAVAAVLLKFRD